MVAVRRSTVFSRAFFAKAIEVAKNNYEASNGTEAKSDPVKSEQPTK